MPNSKRKDAQMVTYMSNMKKDQRGITGLETAIIMIAFVIVASVFAYTVLSAGIFSSEKGKAAVYAGIEHARSSMELVGPVVGKDTDDDDDIDQIVFIVANTLDGEAINFTTTTDSAPANGVLSDETATHTTQISYIDKVQEVTDIAWTQTAVGKNDADNLLEANEKFEITVDISHLTTKLDKDDTFVMEIKPDGGASVVIERTVGAVVDKVNDLN
jgi:archaeal flagellin FlaB